MSVSRQFLDAFEEQEIDTLDMKLNKMGTNARTVAICNARTLAFFE